MFEEVYYNEGDQTPRWREVRLADLIKDDTHPCDDCGKTYYERMGSYWLADDSLWAQVVNDDSIVLCPSCFGQRAQTHGVAFHWEAVRGV